MQPAKKELADSEAVEQKSTVLIAQISWCAHAWNASPKEAAQQIVADLYEHLSRGGMVPVRIEDSDGREQTLEVGRGQ
jgi:hypothetical protein